MYHAFVIMACIIAFVCLAAIFIKCIQKQSVREANRLGEEQWTVRYKEMNPDSPGDSLMNEGSERFNIGHILAKGTGRKHMFTGQPKRVVSPSRKYAN